MSNKPPIKPPVILPGSGKNIIANPTQRLNPVLEHVKGVGREFGDIIADYQVGRTTGVIFLSLRYHRLHPGYIHHRIEGLGNAYSLRMLLLLSDISEHKEVIRELTKTCLINQITILIAFSQEQAGYYLSRLKLYEHKPPDLIKERVEKEYSAILRSALTSISKVNKTDVETLRSNLGSFADIATASADTLQNLPGFGAVKVRRIKDAFERPFRNQATSAPAPSDARQSNGESSTAVNGNVTDAELSTDISEALRRKAARGTATIPAVPNPTQSTTHTKGKGKAPVTREESPPWDIEDIDDFDDEVPTISNAYKAPPPAPPPNQGMDREERPPSPIWDIELDLND